MLKLCLRSLCAEHANVLVLCHLRRNPGAVTWILKWDGGKCKLMTDTFLFNMQTVQTWLKHVSSWSLWIYLLHYHYSLCCKCCLLLSHQTIAMAFLILFAPNIPVSFHLHFWPDYRTVRLLLVIIVLWYTLSRGHVLNSRLFTITWSTINERCLFSN